MAHAATDRFCPTRVRRRPRGPRQRNQLWVAPVVGAALAVMLAAAALAVDHAVNWGEPPMPIFMGEPDTARAMLSIIGGAVATLLALIFTVIAVVIQLAIGQYTPRSLQILLGDRPTHFTIGVFVGTFTYTLVVILGLRVATEGDHVVGLSPTLAFGLAIVTIATFAVYSNHIIHSVRATSIIHRLADQTRIAIETLHPLLQSGEDGDAPPPRIHREPAQIVAAPVPGVLVDLDEDAIAGLLAGRDTALRLVPPIGAFVPEGAPIVAVHGAPVDAAALHRAIRLEPERTMALDASYGLRQLLDVAARALSPGVNDPATAVQVLDELGDLLRRLVRRRLADASWTADDGRPLIAVTVADWETLVLLTLDEMRRLGAGSMPVLRRLRAVLEDLRSVAPPGRRACLDEQLDLLDEATADFATERERHWARISDPRGVGM
jgi:uncharacterized membrane protein